MNEVATDPFLDAYRGRFTNILRWHQLDELWARLRQRSDAGWYIYAVGEEVPAQPATDTEFNTFLTEVDTLLRGEHDEDYCGIVYVDDKQAPTLVKIYDPHNLGAVCGSSGAPPPLPGWVLSLLPPEDLNAAFPPPARRRRWWQRLFAG